MAKQVRGELVVINNGFDYAPLEPSIAKRARDAAERIRDKVKRTIEDIIAVGQDLLDVKDHLEHGQFGGWLKAEFGWTDRTARNYMAVAEQFGPKTEMISDLRIAPTAAYLLAAPSTPEAARQEAIDMAENGEAVNSAQAKKFIANAKKKARRRKPKSVPIEKLITRLDTQLEKLRDRWPTDELPMLAERLSEFAKAIKEGQGKKERQK